MEMVFGNATLHWARWQECVQSWQATSSQQYPVYSVFHRPMMQAYQEIFENTKEPIIAYIHDNVIILEQDWDKRVLAEFDDPTIGAVGFFGGKGHGTGDMYQKPFDPYSFIRIGTLSNMVGGETGGTEAEQHGTRFTGETDVAVFDGLAIFLRREVLEKSGGWPQDCALNYWGYDMAISAEVRRQGYRNRLVGVKFNHLGGKSPSLEWEGKPTEAVNESWLAAHRYLFDHYSDVLPYAVESEQ